MINKDVLILNSSYEPLSICSLKRALIMIFLQKAVIVERYGFEIHTYSQTFPAPSVIRLNYYIRKPYKEPILNKKNIIKRDGFTCQYCGQKATVMTVDHIIPKSLGGQDTWENLVCACQKCNSQKANRTPHAAGLTLIRKPKRPTPLFYLQTITGKPHDAWKSYLFLE